MSTRRRGPAIPLLTLIASFMVVLALGAWLGTGEGRHDVLPTPSPTPSSEGGKATVRISIDELTLAKESWEPFPGVRLTVEPLARQGESAKAVDPEAAEFVKICLTLPENWDVTSAQWPHRNGAKPVCREFDLIAGKILPFELRLARQ
jgi:hypothetical protein